VLFGAQGERNTPAISVNAGRVRILLGSTEKMGAGTNVQKRLLALRQRNENPSVHIHRYVTEGSFDAYMWQLLEIKLGLSIR
jgi:hypothetical protein